MQGEVAQVQELLASAPPVKQDPVDIHVNPLLRRLDQLDRQIKSLTPADKPERPGVQSLPALPDNPAAVVSHETQHHHQHVTQHVHPTERIEQSLSQRAVDPDLDRELAAVPLAPKVVAEETSSRPENRPSETSKVIERQVLINKPLAPSEAASTTARPTRPMVASQPASQPAPAPRIVVERQPSAETVNHTVTVTIGRIEVRATDSGNSHKSGSQRTVTSHYEPG